MNGSVFIYSAEHDMKKKRGRHLRAGLSLDVLNDIQELLAGLGVAAHELVHTSCGVHQLVLAGVEGVRTAGDFQLHYGILLTLEDYGVSGLASGAAQEHVAVAHVLEHNRAIILWMKSFFHTMKCFVSPNFLYVARKWIRDWLMIRGAKVRLFIFTAKLLQNKISKKCRTFTEPKADVQLGAMARSHVFLLHCGNVHLSGT